MVGDMYQRDSYKMKSKVMNFNNDHHKVTGQTLFEGIPYTNLSELIYKKDDPYNLLTLPELLVHKYGNYNNRLHIYHGRFNRFFRFRKEKVAHEGYQSTFTQT